MSKNHIIRRIKQYLQLPPTICWFEYVWLGLPIAVWFSFHPLIRLGQSETMYFELSISVLYLAIVACASIPLIWQARRKLLQDRVVWVTGGFLLLNLLSLLWTPNLTRGLLTCMMSGCLVMVVWGMRARPGNLRRMIRAIIRTYIVTTVAMSIVGLAQFVAGIWLDQSVTLLCAGCQTVQFGFVRPNGFTIEPQFFGGLLVIGAFLLMQEVIKKRTSRFAWIALLLVFVVLLLTLSRGAIFSLLVGGVLFTIVNRKSWYRIGLIVLNGAISIVMALVLQGWAAMSSPVIQETFTGAIEKSVNQMSMGTISLGLNKEEGESLSPISPPLATEVTELEKTTPAFDGYVEESTNIRLTLSEVALTAWSHDVSTQIIGVGVGGAGIAMNQAAPDSVGRREIVQNEYIETLLEGGLMTFGVFIGLLTLAFIAMRKQPWLWAILVSCMVQWLFFSGYPNALHIWLFLIIATVATLHRDQSTPAMRC